MNMTIISHHCKAGTDSFDWTQSRAIELGNSEMLVFTQFHGSNVGSVSALSNFSKYSKGEENAPIILEISLRLRVSMPVLCGR